MPDRRITVVEFPFPLGKVDKSVQDALESLRQSVGLVTSLVVVTALCEHAGAAIVGAALGTVVGSGNLTLDLEDARVDQIRVTGYGSANAVACSVRVMLGANVLCTAALANGAAARFTGAWTVVKLAAGDLNLDVQVVGDGAATQTVFRIDLQCRTLRVGVA